MYKVQTHNGSNEYYKKIDIESNSLHITSNSSLRELIKELHHLEGKNYLINDIDSFLKDIYLDLYGNPIVKIKLVVRLKKTINIVENEFPKLKEQLNFFYSNAEALMDSYLLLIMCGIKEIKQSYDFNNEDRVFAIIFNQFNKDRSFAELRVRLNNSNIIESRLKLLTNEKRIDKIYFYNINKLDLERWTLINKLEYLGIEVIFRVPYFHQFEELSSPWKELYDKKIFNWENNYDNSDYSLAVSKLLDLVEGCKIEEREENILLKNYSNLEEVEKDLKDSTFITLQKDSIKQCFSYDNEIEHCFDTAPGRFLRYAYDCELVDGDVKVKFSTFIELMSSGWVQYKESNKAFNGIASIDFFKKNVELFSTCKSLDEILKTLDTVRDCIEISSIFDESSKDRADTRVERFLSNPFRTLSYVNIEDYRLTINQIYRLAERLKNMLLRLLKEDNGFIDIEKHFQYLGERFLANEYFSNVLEQNKDNGLKKVLNKLQKTINNPPKDESWSREDFRQYFSVFLTLKNETNTEDVDYSIDQLDGLVFREKFKELEQVHITDLSYLAYKEYVKSKKKNRFFLKKNFLKSIVDNLENIELKTILNEGIILEEISKKTIDQFVNFTLVSFIGQYKGKIIFSWIENLRQNDTKSILMQQLEMIYDVEKQSKIEENFLEDIDLSCFNQWTYEKNFEEIVYKHKSIPDPAYRDLDFCNSKFLFSSILNSHPVYYTDFHHRLMLAVWVSLFKNNMDDSYENIKKHVFPLFSKWSDIVKENIALINYSKKNLRDYKKFEKINYPKNIDMLYILRSKYLVTEKYLAKSRYERENLDTKMFFKEFLKQYLGNISTWHSGRHCIMCPHIYECRKGEFGGGIK